MVIEFCLFGVENDVLVSLIFVIDNKGDIEGICVFILLRIDVNGVVFVISFDS